MNKYVRKRRGKCKLDWMGPSHLMFNRTTWEYIFPDYDKLIQHIVLFILYKQHLGQGLNDSKCFVCVFFLPSCLSFIIFRRGTLKRGSIFFCITYNLTLQISWQNLYPPLHFRDWVKRGRGEGSVLTPFYVINKPGIAGAVLQTPI